MGVVLDQSGVFVVVLWSAFLFSFNGLLVFLPVNVNLSYLWNVGSLLATTLIMQLFTGSFLVFYYNTETPFESVQYIMYEVAGGWVIRFLHLNGANFFFILIYIHILKALFYMSYRVSTVWFSGMLLFVFLMAVAFMGYVLVWGQMSFWASVVITSLLGVIPYFGQTLVFWLWGSFLVTKTTLKFFFFFHFLLPFIMCFLVFLHLLTLHVTGSGGPMYVYNSFGKLTFFPYYWYKDALNFLFLGLFFMYLFLFPFFLSEADMFMEANPMLSPVHIVPEWYFLLYYGILRAIPNKLLGVIMLVISLSLLISLPLWNTYMSSFVYVNRLVLGFFVGSCFILSWLGGAPAEGPFILLGLYFTVLYFIFMFMHLLFNMLMNFS